MNTKEIGDKSEIIIFCELIKRGYQVLKPWGDRNRYDFVIDRGNGNFSRVQSKTGYIENSVVRFAPVSHTTKNGKNVKTTYSKDEIDYFIVYCRTNEQIYCIKIEDCPIDVCFLRLEPPQNGQKKKIRMAKDFLLDQYFPALA